MDVASGEYTKLAAIYFGPLWGVVVGAGGMLGLSHLKDHVGNVHNCLDKADECASQARRQLMMIGRSHADNMSLVGVLGIQSDLDLMIDRVFADKDDKVRAAQDQFGEAVASCDHNALAGLQLGQDPADAIALLAKAQSELRHAITSTSAGWVAKLVGRKMLG